MRTDWGKFLAERGLESPGREEAVRQTVEHIARKKELEKLRQEQKAKRKPRKKR